MTWPLPMRGRRPCSLRELVIERHEADRILEEHGRHADRREGPRDGGRNRHAVDPAARRQRPIGHHDHAGGARLLELANDERAEVGERRLRPVDRLEAIAGLPFAQADEVEPRAVKAAGVLADRELAHPLQDEQLDLGDIRQADERLAVVLVGRAPRRVAASHGIGTRWTTSSMTASVVRPWLAACGPSQMRWPSTYGARSWMSSG